MRKLKIWNGGGHICRNLSSPLWKGIDPFKTHAYAAAHSRADLRRLIASYNGVFPGETYIRDYWAEGAWGNSMEGITPERGLWISFDHWAKPVRVI